MVMRIINHRLQYILFFIVPFALLASCYILFGMYPYGAHSILISDLNTQYVQFYTYLYRVFTEGKSLQYSFELGGGLNFIGTFAYYLSSPLSLLILFFKEDTMPEAILVITLIKIGFAGLTCGWFLTALLGNKGKGILLFSTAYALMGYVIAYSFHVMWLDAIIMLPILLHAVEKLVLYKKITLFIVALAVTFICNFYISYMVGVFTFLYLLVRLFSVYSVKEFKQWVTVGGLFAFGTAFSAGLAAWIILPTYKALKNNPYNVVPLEFKLEWKLNMMDFYWKLLSGGYDSSVFGAPTVYASILVLILFPLYIFIKEISRKEKWLFIIFSIFMVCSFAIPFLNLAWHGLKWPNAYPYRYAFVFSLLMIIMAARVFQHISKAYVIPLWGIYALHLAFIAVLWNQKPDVHIKILSVNIALLTAIVLVLTLKMFKPSLSRITTLLLLLCMGVDVGLNTSIYIKHLDYEMHYTMRKDYTVDKNIEEAFHYVNKDNTEQYRVSSMYFRTLNNSLQYNYPSFQTFNTMANGAFHKFLRKTGYSTSSDFLVVNNFGDTLLFDSIFRVGYRIDDGKIPKYGFQKLAQFNYANVLKNQLVVPFGYPLQKVDSSIKNEQDPFAFQERLIGAQKGELFETIPNVKMKMENIQPSSEAGKYERTIKEQPGYITLSMTVPKDMQLYILAGNFQNWTEAVVNEQYASYLPPANDKSIIDAGFMRGNKRATIKLKVEEDFFMLDDIRVVGLDIDKFKQTVSSLQNQSMTVKKREGVTIEGAVTLKDDSTFVFPIPYDEGWIITVDGKEVKSKKVAEGLVGVNLSKGKHNLTLSFHSPGLQTGIIISVISLFLFVGFVVWQRKSKTYNKQLSK